MCVKKRRGRESARLSLRCLTSPPPPFPPPCFRFFVTLAPAPSLDGKHTIFGRVCAGMETVKRLGSVITDANDRPTSDVVLVSARLV